MQHGLNFVERERELDPGEDNIAWVDENQLWVKTKDGPKMVVLFDTVNINRDELRDAVALMTHAKAVSGNPTLEAVLAMMTRWLG